MQARFQRRRTLTACAAFLVLAAMCGRPSAAQTGRKTEVALTGGLSYIDFRGVGGFGAFVMQARLGHRFSAAWGADLSVFTVIPGGAATTDASCVPGGVCSGFETPSSVSGAAVSLVRFAGETGIRASVGIGGARTFSGAGLGATESIGGTIGIDWVPNRSWRVRPAIGVRVMQLARPASRVRQIFLPGVGIVF